MAAKGGGGAGGGGKSIVLKSLDTSFIERYDHFLLDQWGVLHDGSSSLDGYEISSSSSSSSQVVTVVVVVK